MSFEVPVVQPTIVIEAKRAPHGGGLPALEPERDDFIEPLLPLTPACDSDVWWWCGPRGDRRDGGYLRKSYVVG
jgi:hypothetical protein